ncbi:MAG: hypothetical protein COA94_04375, partial [Rickettsiales bacterium]
TLFDLITLFVFEEEFNGVVKANQRLFKHLNKFYFFGYIAQTLAPRTIIPLIANPCNWLFAKIPGKN